MIEINKIYDEDDLIIMNKNTDKFLSGIITLPLYNITTKIQNCHYNTVYSNSDNIFGINYINIRIEDSKKYLNIK